MKKGNMTTIASVFVIALVALGVGMGTMAYFSDEVTSVDNVLTAGTFEMSIGSDSVSGTWTVGNWAPGMTKSATLTITNIGTLPIVNIKIRPTSIVDSDSEYKLSEMIIIDEFTVVKDEKSMPHMESWMDASSLGGIFGNGDDELTLAEFGGPHNYWFVTGEEDYALEPTETMTVYLEFRFDEDAGNDYQGDSCTFTLTIYATQGPLDHTVIGDCGYGL